MIERNFLILELYPISGIKPDLFRNVTEKFYSEISLQ